eukprot:7784503-Lingulodinium_polyedra.AAC.1
MAPTQSKQRGTSRPPAGRRDPARREPAGATSLQCHPTALYALADGETEIGESYSQSSQSSPEMARP